MYKIYKIIDNTNSNVYIGRTTRTLNQRLREHKNDYKTNPNGAKIIRRKLKNIEKNIIKIIKRKKKIIIKNIIKITEKSKKNMTKIKISSLLAWVDDLIEIICRY